MIDLQLTEKEFRLVRLAVASCTAKLALRDTEALTTLIEKFIAKLVDTAEQDEKTSS